VVDLEAVDQHGRPSIIIVIGGATAAVIAREAALVAAQVATDYPSSEPVTVVVADQEEHLVRLRERQELLDRAQELIYGETDIDRYAAMDAMVDRMVLGPIRAERACEQPDRPWLDRTTRRRGHGRGAQRPCTIRTAGRDKSFGRGSWR
jgi:hypothetical protein